MWRWIFDRQYVVLYYTVMSDTIVMKSLNQEHITAVLEFINRSPFFTLLSMEACALQPGYCRVDIDLDRKHHNPFGGVHGGVYASIIETAAFWAAYGELAENVGLISIDLTVDNLAAATDGKLIVEGRVIKAGRRICLCEATVMDSRGKLIAHGTSKLMIAEGMPSVSQSVSAMGYPSLPPKFTA